MPRLCPPLPFHAPFEQQAIEPNEFLLGRLVLPTGQLVVCDPLSHLATARPLARSVRPGIYAVRLGALGGDAAYVGVLVGEGEVLRWEVALGCGARAPDSVAVSIDLASAPRLGAGFPVNASTAAYFDVAGLHALSTLGRHGLGHRLLEAGYLERPHAVVDLAGAGNLVAFGTGSEGPFASYWGLDRKDAPVVLITDLGVLQSSRALPSNVIPLRRER